MPKLQLPHKILKPMSWGSSGLHNQCMHHIYSTNIVYVYYTSNVQLGTNIQPKLLVCAKNWEYIIKISNACQKLPGCQYSWDMLQNVKADLPIDIIIFQVVIYGHRIACIHQSIMLIDFTCKIGPLKTLIVNMHPYNIQCETIVFTISHILD